MLINIIIIGVDEAVMLEPLGVAHNAMEQLDVEGQDVLILGCGPVGLLACSVAKALGANRYVDLTLAITLFSTNPRMNELQLVFFIALLKQ